MSNQPTVLRVFSWNMLCFNTQLEDALEFIKGLDADVICLQEVPQAFCSKLDTLVGYNRAFGIDTNRRNKKTGEKLHDYVVILSRYPLFNVRSRNYIYRKPASLRWKIFDWLTYGRAETTFVYQGNRSFVSADIYVGRRDVHIVCGHPSVWGARLRELEIGDMVKSGRSSWFPIVCGDLNILDHWLISMIVNSLCAYSIFDVFREGWPFYPERKRITKLFKRWSFKNPLEGFPTFSTFDGRVKLQLDHILVPATAHVRSRGIIPELHGSDHHPVMVTIEVPS